MINIPPIKPSTNIKTELIPDISKTWKVGQILNATTVQGGGSLSKVLIQLGQHTLEAKTPIPLQTGQEVKLLVKALTTHPTESQAVRLPLLSIIPTNPHQASETETKAVIKLRQFIAVQQSFTELQQLSTQLLTDKTGTQKIPEPLKELLSNIQNTLQLNNKDINAAQLKQHVLNSGIFFESKLLNQTDKTATPQKPDTAIVNDFKYQLLAIKSELAQYINTQPEPKPGIQPITQTQLNQLHTLIQQTNSNIDGLSHKLMSVLPRHTIIQFTNILANPETPVSTTDEQQLQALVKTFISTSQQQGQAQQLLDQLRFRLMLLDLGQQVDQSISKLTSLQLQPLIREGDNLILLLFNLVFKDSHEQFDLSFRVQQENENTETDNESWQISLNFNFKTLGKVQSNIHLINNQVSTVFHTEFSSTADKIQQLLPLLEKGLKNAGLNIINLNVINQLFDASPLVNEHINLLDENV